MGSNIPCQNIRELHAKSLGKEGSSYVLPIWSFLVSFFDSFKVLWLVQSCCSVQSIPFRILQFLVSSVFLCLSLLFPSTYLQWQIFIIWSLILIIHPFLIFIQINVSHGLLLITCWVIMFLHQHLVSNVTYNAQEIYFSCRCSAL